MRYAVLSDIHGNLPALAAVLADLQPLAEALIFLGDAVGYYAESPAVLAALREVVAPLPVAGQSAERRLPWLAGNHEWGLLGRIEERQFSPAALAALRRTRADLAAGELAFLAGLPARAELQLADGLAATLVHASPADPAGAGGAGYIENAEDAREAAQLFGTQICLVGHTHYPRACYEAQACAHGQPRWEAAELFDDLLPGGLVEFGARRALLNPGSVGQPRDGDPRAAYGLLDTAARSFCVRRVPYDIGLAQARVRAWLHEAPPALLDGQGGLAARLAQGI